MSQVKFTASEYDQYDDEVKYQITFTNEFASSFFEFYGYSDTFQEFATGLIKFPKSITDIVLFEAGGNNKKWAYYMQLNVFCYEKNGHTAIQIIIDNHRQSPDTIKTEFYIKTVPASINNLGKQLISWDPKTEKELLWISK